MTHTPGLVVGSITRDVDGCEMYMVREGTGDGWETVAYVYDEDFARLIAAAPEMLALVTAVANEDHTGEVFAKIARALLAKIEGK